LSPTEEPSFYAGLPGSEPRTATSFEHPDRSTALPRSDAVDEGEFMEGRDGM
jgi:hypothetical protein